ncbi:unnamed protein product, partial [Aphanomyces euteiches]
MDLTLALGTHAGANVIVALLLLPKSQDEAGGGWDSIMVFMPTTKTATEDQVDE